MTRTDFDRAYADVLFSHIDRLGDPCPEDPLEKIVEDLLSAFARVDRLDPRMNTTEGYRAARSRSPWLFPGDTVWAPAAPGAASRQLMTVQLCFEGADRTVHCLLEVQDEDRVLYRCWPLLALAPTAQGPSFHEQMLANPTCPEFLPGLLRRLGLPVPEALSPSEPDRPVGRAPGAR